VPLHLAGDLHSILLTYTWEPSNNAGNIRYTTGNRALPSGNGAEVAGHGAEVAGHEAEIDGHGAEVAGNVPEVAGHEAEVVGHEAEVAGNVPEVVGHEAEVAGHEAEVAGHEAEIDGHEVEVAGNEVKVAGNVPEVGGHEVKVVGNVPEVDGNGAEVAGNVPEVVGHEAEVVGHVPEVGGNAPGKDGKAPEENSCPFRPGDPHLHPPRSDLFLEDSLTFDFAYAIFSFQMKKCSIIAIVLLFYGVLSAVQLELKERKSLIYDDNHFLQLPGGLCLSPDGTHLIVPDIKAGDIKIFSRASGRLVKVEGRRGVGPDELLMPCKCTNDERHLALLDLGRRCYFVYEFIKPVGLKRIDEGMQVNAGFDCCLDNGGLVLAALIYGDRGRNYDAYRINLTNKSIKYLLPSEIKYGFSSIKEYETAYKGNDILPIGIQSYCDVYDGYLYYSWLGDLRIIRVNISTGGIATFGQKTQNYSKPKVSNRFATAYAERDKTIYAEERRKLTLIDDINASKSYIILSYMKPDSTLDRQVRMLQFYGHDQKLIAEIRAPREISFNDESEAANIIMDRKNDRLIGFRRFLNKQDEDRYEFLVYDIVK